VNWDLTDPAIDGHWKPIRHLWDRHLKVIQDLWDPALDRHL
jgi:hypothetical protein